MARIITKSFSDIPLISISDVRSSLQWEFLGFDPAPTGMNSYISTFDVANFIGYQYILYGSGTATSSTNFAARLRDSSSELTGSHYAWAYFNPSVSSSMYSTNSQSSFYTTNNYFTKSIAGHPTIRASVFLKSPTQTDFEMQFSPSNSSGYQQSMLFGNYTNNALVGGVKLYPQDNASFCVNGGVYRFGLRRRS